jgi:hypothetical protein
MDMVMTLVWYPWTEGEGGPAGTRGAFRTLDLRLEDAGWPRLPNVGETIFFDDGGAAAIEAVGWKLDGTAYLYLGKRYEKKGDALQSWLTRGFADREGTQQPEAEAQPEPVADAQVPAESGAAPGAAADAPTVPTTLPPMPGDAPG